MSNYQFFVQLMAGMEQGLYAEEEFHNILLERLLTNQQPQQQPVPTLPLYEFTFTQQVVPPTTHATHATVDYKQFKCYAYTHAEAFDKFCHSAMIQDLSMNELGLLTVSSEPYARIGW